MAVGLELGLRGTVLLLEGGIEAEERVARAARVGVARLRGRRHGQTATAHLALRRSPGLPPTAQPAIASTIANAATVLLERPRLSSSFPHREPSTLMRGVRRAYRKHLDTHDLALYSERSRAAWKARRTRRMTSIAHKLQREIVLLLAWGPAILLQLAHPLVARAIADHSAFRRERHGELARFHGTLSAMLDLCFGTEQQAAAVLARINAIHDRVNGHCRSSV